jgi:hypothetical protein
MDPKLIPSSSCRSQVDLSIYVDLKLIISLFGSQVDHFIYIDPKLVLLFLCNLSQVYHIIYTGPT